MGCEAWEGWDRLRLAHSGLYSLVGRGIRVSDLLIHLGLQQSRAAPQRQTSKSRRPDRLRITCSLDSPGMSRKPEEVSVHTSKAGPPPSD